MYEEMNRCGDLFDKSGGHKMAAGLSMKEADIDEFRRRINEYCTLTEDDMTEKAVIDIPMPIDYATFDFAKELSRLEPYGNGNPKPVFAQKSVIPSDIKVLGKNHNVVKLYLKTDKMTGRGIEAMCFGEGDEISAGLKSCDRIDVLYEVGINEYMGRQSVQLIIKDWKQT